MNMKTPDLSNKQAMFSLVTGDIYFIEPDEYKNMDKYQIPLKKLPSSSCKQCYGRMYIGFNTTLKIYQLCHKCANTCVDINLMGHEDLEIETIKHA